ncbi:hypothetical protein Bca52824_022304 [Brassica carinata]|uniref:Uncharacterized protein n=1 Tax=Brassica carinata TaxID=52824 RepID=A0A8X8ASY3_BRACI|nr:hypothetical protein Bca52824_022304 [Brassica carinata]
MTPELPEEHVDTQNLNNRTPMVLGWRPDLKSASKIVGTAIPGSLKIVRPKLVLLILQVGLQHSSYPHSASQLCRCEGASGLVGVATASCMGLLREDGLVSTTVPAVHKNFPDYDSKIRHVSNVCIMRVSQSV